jgi:16S rRNA (adenine1518-N6/adenine1519-N6)-dimethyltransferase
MKLKKSLGQNFLKNEIISYKIVENITNEKCENILEIGCGAGALTKFINERNWKNFWIVEFDDFWAGNARKNFKNAKVFNKNILDFDLKSDLNWIVIGNIPYNITYGILKKIIEWRNFLEKIVLMVQEEVALKLYNKKGKDYGPISVLMQLFFEVELSIKVLPENFSPAPKVTSRIVIFTPKKNMPEIKNYEEFSNFLSVIFKHPRKKIKNNIAASKYESKIEEKYLDKRAQEIFSEEIYEIWVKI